jgi:hypothetical protein
MGITAFDIKFLEKYIDKYKPDRVIEFGSQNLYITQTNKPPFASEWYNEKGVYYECIDLGGDNNAIQKDVSYPIAVGRQYPLVTDFGFGEHVVQMEDYIPVTYNHHITSVYPKGEINIEDGYYNFWLNKHNLCKIGGLIISENPESKSWLGHGYTYLVEDFYKELAKVTDYEILELGRHPAMGNDKDGWNVYSVIRKHSEVFPSFDIFNSLPIFKS